MSTGHLHDSVTVTPTYKIGYDYCGCPNIPWPDITAINGTNTTNATVPIFTNAEQEPEPEGLYICHILYEKEEEGKLQTI